MSILKQLDFNNIQCDFCGRLCSEEWFPNDCDIKSIAEASDWYILGGKCYCSDCWSYNNIFTKDGKMWNSKTLKEIK